MENEMKMKLEKYMQTNGYYDIVRIREDEGEDELDATFGAFFGGNEGDEPEEMSAELKFATEYNKAKAESDDVSELAQAVAAEQPTARQWKKLEEHGLAVKRNEDAEYGQYNEWWERTTPVLSTVFADETEEDLAARNL